MGLVYMTDVCKGMYVSELSNILRFEDKILLMVVSLFFLCFMIQIAEIILISFFIQTKQAMQGIIAVLAKNN